MEFSYQYSNTMSLLAIGDESTCNRVPSSCHFTSNNIYNRWLTVCKSGSKGCIEIPSCIIRMVDLRFVNEDSFKIIVPIYISSNTHSRSGAETVLKDFSRSSFSNGLAKITTNKGEVYYGCKGLILDKDYNPLLMSTYRISYDNINVVEALTIRVSPSVFTNDTDSLNKSLARKGIPYYLGQFTPHRIPNRWFNINIPGDRSNIKVSVSIEDLSNWINTPEKPKNPVNLSTDINKFVKENIDDVLIQFLNDNH